MRKYFGLIIISLLLQCGARAETFPEIPFPMGERLQYRLYWGWIHAANSVTTTDWVEVEGKLYIRILSRTQSRSVLDKLYPVDDTLETLIDPATLLPWRFVKIQNEGRHHKDELTYFDHEAGTAKWRQIRKNGEVRNREDAIEPNTRDLLTFMYMTRGEPLQANTELLRNVMADEKLYEMLIHIGDETREKTKRYGKVKCLKMVPEAKFEGLFVRKGKMDLWISNDERRMMVKMVVDTPFANVKMKIHKVSGGLIDSWNDKPLDLEKENPAKEE